MCTWTRTRPEAGARRKGHRQEDPARCGIQAPRQHPQACRGDGGGGDKSCNAKLVKLLKSKNKTVVGDFACKGLDKLFVLRFVGGVNKGCPTAQDLQDGADFLRGVVASLC